MSVPEALVYRQAVQAADEARIRELVGRTGFFSAAEVEIAAELVRETASRGDAAGYWFTLAEQANELLGFCCYGPIPCTVSSYDMYWIAVAPEAQGRGLGRDLMVRAEAHIRRLGGTQVYVDTSGRAQYQPTRAFYERLGYVQQARLDDFYAPGDAKVVYGKRLD